MNRRHLLIVTIIIIFKLLTMLLPFVNGFLGLDDEYLSGIDLISIAFGSLIRDFIAWNMLFFTLLMIFSVLLSFYNYCYTKRSRIKLISLFVITIVNLCLLLFIGNDGRIGLYIWNIILVIELVENVIFIVFNKKCQQKN